MLHGTEFLNTTTVTEMKRKTANCIVRI